MKNLNQLLQQATKKLQQGDTAEAKVIALKLNKKIKNNPVILHLLALIFKKENNFQLAKKYFEQSLSSDSSQAPVLANYANLLVELSEFEKAKRFYLRATKLDSEFTDAWYNWAGLLNSLGEYSKAKIKIEKAILLNPNAARYHCVLGVSLSSLEQFSEALDAFAKAEELCLGNDIDRVNVLQNKAYTLRAMHEPVNAIETLEKLIDKGLGTSNVYYIRACANYDSDNYKDTENDLIKAIELMPDNVNAHQALNKLYWESSNDSKFLSSYQSSLQLFPRSEKLHSAYLSQLILAERYVEAQEQIAKSQSILGKRTFLLYAQSQVFSRTSNGDKAKEILQRLVKVDKNNIRARIDLANILITAKNYKEALVHLEFAGNIDGLDQEIWASKGLCWRLMNDPRSEWLNNYKHFISAEFLDCPNGYDNLEHFLKCLKIELEGQHKTNRQPLDQSVKLGTQTVGNLLTVPNKVIQDYRGVLEKRVKNYIDALPKNSEHPFLNRITKDFRHSGAWSVKLQSGGYHSNHMHPQGWLSNCTYINVPKDINSSSEAGWIKFGETCLDLGERNEIAKKVCPQEGLSVLFPSYFWHGTIPFDSSEFRVTLPSDIMPV